jgi:penicillin amidase
MQALWVNKGTGMGVIFRLVFRFLVIVLVLAILGVLGVYYLASRSLPDYDKTIALVGPTAPIEIVRDTANVPHIFGQTNDDVFFGLGYAHAQDRLWQMATMRRTVQGRLSEVFGEKTLEVDILLRRLDLYNLAKSSVAAQDAASLAALEAYSKGINARIQEINENALGRGAPEMFLFDAPFAPWQPADSLAIQKLMALQLSGHLANEVLRAKTSLQIPFPDRLDDLLPNFPGDAVIDLPEYAAAMGTPYFQSAKTEPQHPLSPVRPYDLAGASNAFAAATSRSAAGGTLLANDPHLGLTAPSIWYLAHLELTSGGVIGGTIPGIPAVLVGRSDVLGWGLTSSYLDDQDVLMEEINPNNPEEYRTATGWATLTSRPTIINIKGGAPITLTLRWTRNGPVLPTTQYGLAEVTPTGHVPALQWTALSDNDPSFSSALRLMSARSVYDAIAGFEGYVSPPQNLTLVDQTQIAMKSIGAFPIRDAAHQTQGRMPALGWQPENQWKGMRPFSQTPEIVNPVGGILGNTNNKIVDAPFPDHMSFTWGDSQRIRRWERLMQDRQVHTRESFIEAQLDTVSFTAQSLLPLTGANLWFTGESAEKGTLERQRQDALKLLASWNGEMNEHLPEPLIYMAWMRALQDRLIRDELGPVADDFTKIEPLFIEKVFRNIDGAGVWCDVLQSSPIETCEQIARQSLDDALIWLGENFDRDPNALRWGDAHQATHDHPVLGKVPVLQYFVNIRQHTSGGDNTLMRGRTIGKGPNPYLNVHAAAYRGVYDFSDPDSSVFISSTGQSGHFLSRHYDDLGQLWRRGEYIQMSLDPNLARGAATGITIITPSQGQD